MERDSRFEILQLKLQIKDRCHKMKCKKWKRGGGGGEPISNVLFAGIVCQLLQKYEKERVVYGDSSALFFTSTFPGEDFATWGQIFESNFKTQNK